MQIIPVLDLLEHMVVRGVAGNRDQYRPIVSRLAAKSDPLSVARAFRDRLGLIGLYVADLDAILNGQANWDVYRALSAEGFRLMVDAGVHDARMAGQLLDAGADSVIVGLETCPGPESLEALCRTVGAELLVFSLDLKSGEPLGDLSAWGTADPFAIGRRAVEAGVRRLIVLDLAQVGVAGGLITTDLCRRILDRFPEIRLITGGGVRNRDDLDRLQVLGVEGALVASALHDGKLTREDVNGFK